MLSAFLTRRSRVGFSGTDMADPLAIDGWICTDLWGVRQARHDETRTLYVCNGYDLRRASGLQELPIAVVKWLTAEPVNVVGHMTVSGAGAVGVQIGDGKR